MVGCGTGQLKSEQFGGMEKKRELGLMKKIHDGYGVSPENRLDSHVGLFRGYREMSRGWCQDTP